MALVLRRFAEWVWYANHPVAGLTRTALRPASALFGAVVAQRNARFDATGAEGVLPAVSIGNLTVGGTGKTPVSSWFAARLAERGGRPAIVLRGYGDDEWRVHEVLTPQATVVVNADRRAALVEARANGADCAVLDDAFQHRRVRRVSDIVLISVDRFTPEVRLLPSGPYREGLASLRRATAVVLTVKAAPHAQVERTLAVIARAAPHVPLAVVHLIPHRVCSAAHTAGEPVSENTQVSNELEWLSGRRLLLASAIADGKALERQVVAQGVKLVRHLRFPDHHDFTSADVANLVHEARDAEGVLCTLKDAVKLAPLWPRAAAPLWYVSQTLVVDRGAEVLERECDRVLAARAATVPTVG